MASQLIRQKERFTKAQLTLKTLMGSLTDYLGPVVGAFSDISPPLFN